LKTDSLGLHWINLVTASEFLKLVVLSRIHHLTHLTGMRSIAKSSDHPIELPM
jgi:hypothetical protein